MLHTETVDGSTLELIRQLQSDPVFKDFVLVGGTALSLQIGHRISVDIDFFTQREFDNTEMLEHLEHNYGFKEQYRSVNTLKGIIDGVFVDLLRHNYKYIADHLILERYFKNHPRSGGLSFTIFQIKNLKFDFAL